jgi:hypothetical protein
MAGTSWRRCTPSSATKAQKRSGSKVGSTTAVRSPRRKGSLSTS